MIFLTLIEDLYFISHCSKQVDTEKLFVFHKDFLPDRILLHIHSLSASKSQENQTLFLQTVLTSRQDQEAAIIFHKLCSKRKTDYVFAEQLQKTHLMELLHLITRVHHSTTIQA